MNREELVLKLNLVGRALAQNNLVPMLQNYCFTTSVVVAYNDALAIVAPCETSHPFCANGKILLSLLAASTGETADLDIKDENLVIKSGRSTFKLPWQPAADFPFDEPNIEASIYFLRNTVLKDASLLMGLKACLLTTSRDQSQAALMAICVKAANKHAVMYSTDGDAISKITIPIIPGGKGEFLLPSEFCEAVISIADDIDVEKAGMYADDEWVAARIDDYVIYGRLIKADNPVDHEDLIKKTLRGKNTFLPVPKGLDLALTRARVVSDIETVPTVLKIEGKNIKLLTDSKLGTIKDVITFGDHPDVEAHVSAELVQRCLSMATQMAVQDNCCVFKDDGKLLILVSNMD